MLHRKNPAITAKSSLPNLSADLWPN